jgi:hypothetical protein
MTLGKQSRPWTKTKDSDAVSKLAKEYNLDTDIDTTEQEHPQIEQNQESDFEFMKKLATRNHFEFYVSPPRTLRFGKPRDKGDGIVTLRWGQSLLSFKPEANLAAQVSQVEVYGWNSDQKKAIVGKATAGGESGHDPRRQSGGERLAAAFGKQTVLQVRQPVFTEAEAKRRAEAILNDHAKKFLTGDAECIGLPDLLPDRNITLGNPRRAVLEDLLHPADDAQIDTSGYKTRVKVKETRCEQSDRRTGAERGHARIWRPCQRRGRRHRQGQQRRQWPGTRQGEFSLAQRTDAEPLGTGRDADGRQGQGHLFHSGGRGRSARRVRARRSPVPYILGSLWNGKDKSAENNGDGKNDIRQIKSRAGHKIIFNDGTKKLLQLLLSDGKTLKITEDGILVDDGKGNSFEISSNGGSITVKASTEVKISAPKIALDASGTIDVKAGGTLTLKGSVVNIN